MVYGYIVGYETATTVSCASVLLVDRLLALASRCVQEKPKMQLWKASYILLSAASTVSAKLTWGTTKFLFTFGDSYTTDGFNITAGVDSPVPGFVGAGCVRRANHTLTRVSFRLD